MGNRSEQVGMIDAVVSFHQNPMACGVAKYNRQLAERLGVPCVAWPGMNTTHPLVSMKPSEMRNPGDRYWESYDLLLHDRTLPLHAVIVDGADRVFYADELGCPSTVQGNPDRGSYRVLTFGMAHKLVLPHFHALKARLDREHPGYTISLSTAVHEGSPWDETLQSSTEAMRAIFGDRLRVLGFLADDALAKELQDCDAVAAYFTPALRANNTSYWAAIAAGKPVYTNRDACSPSDDQQPTWEKLIEALRA